MKRQGKRSNAKTGPTTARSRYCQSRSTQQPFFPDAQRGYRHAIDEFVDWYAPSRDYPSAGLSWSDAECIWNRGTSRQEQSNCGSGPHDTLRTKQDCGLLSADLAAGIRCAGVKKLGVRLGNSLHARGRSRRLIAH